jgi:predicted transcriptional regulator
MATTPTMKHVGFTVPPPIEEELEQMAKEEHRTKSEMFREMVRFYRTYRKRFERIEDERFERMIDQVIQEAIQAQEEGRSLMTDEETEKMEQELMNYGAAQAKKVGIDVDDDEEINRIIHGVRARRREKERNRA